LALRLTGRREQPRDGLVVLRDDNLFAGRQALDQLG
jgi:hypothetical protein